MAAPVPIPSSSGLIPGNTLTTIYHATTTGTYSKITNMKFSPQDLSMPYEIKLYLSFDSGARDVLIYYKTMDGGDSIDDNSIYFLTTSMRLKVWVNVDNLISYIVNGEVLSQ